MGTDLQELKSVLKLSCTNVVYHYEPKNNATVAIITVRSELFSPKTFKGVAVMNKKDEYSKSFGEKLARARAERDAYLYFAEKLKEEYENIMHDKIVIENTIFKCRKYIIHQKEYIKTFK